DVVITGDIGREQRDVERRAIDVVPTGVQVQQIGRRQKVILPERGNKRRKKTGSTYSIRIVGQFPVGVGKDRAYRYLAQAGGQRQRIGGTDNDLVLRRQHDRIT